MKLHKKEDSYRTGRYTGEQELRCPVGNQAEIEKLAIGTRTDSNGNDQGTKKWNYKTNI